MSDEARTDRPSISTTKENIQRVRKIILYNHRSTTREAADDVHISFGSYQAIFTDVLGMNKAAAQIVPKLLNS